MTTSAGRRLSQGMEQCIQECLDCHHICLETVAYCLQQGGRHADAAHIRVLLDCAEICQTAANFMCSGSGFAARLCLLCADVTECCAEVLELLSDDTTLTACADACRRCAASCQRVGEAALRSPGPWSRPQGPTRPYTQRSHGTGTCFCSK